PGAVGVVVLFGDAVFVEVLRGRGAGFDVAGRGDVVGGDRVPEQGKHSGAGDVGDRRRVGGHPVEVRGFAHVGGVGVPVEGFAFRGGQVTPALVALEHVGVAVGEHFLVDRGRDDLGDLLGRRP